MILPVSIIKVTLCHDSDTSPARYPNSLPEFAVPANPGLERRIHRTHTTARERRSVQGGRTEAALRHDIRLIAIGRSGTGLSTPDLNMKHESFAAMTRRLADAP